MASYKLHPLALINVSDHHTRVAAQLDKGETSVDRVMGCLLGFQTGTREVEICTSFEVSTKRDAETDALLFEPSYLSDQIARYKQVFPTFDVVGWYATGSKVDSNADLLIHRSLAQLNESLVFLRFDPTNHDDDAGGRKKGELPVSLYEVAVKSSVISAGTSSSATVVKEAFVSAEYRIETVEAERVAVDHVSRATREEDGRFENFSSHVDGVVSAVEMLDARLDAVVRYLKDVRDGIAHPEKNEGVDHEILRAASRIAAARRRMPNRDASAFAKDFENAMEDARVVNALGALTKAAAEFEAFAIRHSIAGDGGRRRGF
jgi:COP9 signalosome complex subunit 6